MWRTLIDAVLGIVFGIYRFSRGVLDNCPKIVRRRKQEQATAMVIPPPLFGFSKNSSYGTSTTRLKRAGFSSRQSAAVSMLIMVFPSSR
jgi:hypothetical protein